MILVPARLDHAEPAPGGPADAVVQRYRAFFALLAWDRVPERDPHRPWPGPVPQPRTAYLKALLVKLCEQKVYVTQLRTLLVEHPGLVLELGFRPVEDPTQPAGFDVARTVPSVRWLRHHQQTTPDVVLQILLAATVERLQAEMPSLGTTIAVDVKHSYAWVQENNPKASVAARYDAAQQPRADPDCRLGVKSWGNQAGAAGAGRRKECVWGYGTGVASATLPPYGDVVLAEWTQPFNRQDVTYYHPLYQRAAAALGFRPRNVAADAAFDAWHVYQTCADQDGIAAIPLNRRGQPPPDRDAAGPPALCRGPVDGADRPGPA
jgi:hypothetical protein